jgi:small subunit ribosomal protein S1
MPETPEPTQPEASSSPASINEAPSEALSAEVHAQPEGERVTSPDTSNVDANAQEASGASESDDDGDETSSGDGDEPTSAGDEAAASGSSASEGGEVGEGGEGVKKRKRRRRRKRKDGTSAGDIAAGGASGTGGEAGEGHGPSPSHGQPSRGSDKKKESHAPFAHLFSGAQGGKRHAFAVGEVVAGRVQRVDYGVIVVDLFGKATAIADEYEPREVPPLPELPPPTSSALDGGVPIVAAEPDPSIVETTDVPCVDHQVTAPSADDAGTRTAADVLGGHLSASAPLDVDGGAEPRVQPEAEAAAQPAPEAVAAPAEPAQTTTGSGELYAAQAEHDAHEDELDDDHDDDHEPAIAPPHEKPEPPKLGAVFKGRVGAVSESGHVAILNRIIDGKSVREQLESKRQEHKRVHGVVYGFNRGGFDVLVEGLRAFCPASAMALEDIGDPLDYVGRKLEFLLPASRAGSKDLIVSRRSILERLQRRKTKDFLRSLTPGQKFKGRVTAVRDFGLFVDIGGIEGLVHQSELSFAFGVKPNSVAKVGDEIDVQVLRVGGGDARRDSGRKERLTRVSLSVKALLPDPWDQHADALSEGNVHKGKVVRATEFGAFVEIVPEIEGLLHITELGRDLKHGSQAVKEGEEIYVVVDRVDRRSRRISLSKLSPAEVQEFEAGSLTKDDAAARNLRQGNNVKVKIERIDPRVVHARVAGTVGRRGRAFIPSSETGTERGTDLRKKFPIGSEIEVKIIGIDRDGSLKCSVKALLIDEERQAVKNYRREAAKQGFGTFGDLLRAKLGEAQTKS